MTVQDFAMLAAAALAVLSAALLLAWLGGRRQMRRMSAEFAADRRAHEAAAVALRERAATAEREAAVSARDCANAVALTARADEAARQLRAEMEAIEAAREDAELRIATMAADARAFERQIEDLKAARELMRQEFKATAGEALKAQGEAFKSQNTEQLGHLLTPLKEDIVRFKESLGAANLESARQHGSLKEQIERLSLQSSAVSKEAENLTRALKGNVQMQGAWGEMVLETVLQRLGMREGHEFSRQESHTDENGRVRTDYVFNLPQGDRLVIDSKVSLVDFEAYANAEDEAERAARLAAHVRSVRAHVRGLAAKGYADRVGSRIDFVVMFMPIEAALGAALSHDAMLAVDALEQKIAIATPTTLNTTLQIVAAAWRVERQNRHAEDIAHRAGKLYDKFCGFVADIDRLGERLTLAQSSYDEARKKLAHGSGNLVRQAELLRAMGAKTTAALKAPLLEEAGATEHAALLTVDFDDAAEASPTVQ